MKNAHTSGVSALETIEDKYTLNYVDGQVSIECQYRDFIGETHSLIITLEAIRNLCQKADEALMVILDRSVSAGANLTLDLISGPNRGEVYLPGGGDVSI